MSRPEAVGAERMAPGAARPDGRLADGGQILPVRVVGRERRARQGEEQHEERDPAAEPELAVQPAHPHAARRTRGLRNAYVTSTARLDRMTVTA